MKTLHVIHIHSFVDLITNSSSELFVCNGKKSIEAAKDFLFDLAEFHSKHNEEKITKDTLFTSILKEPELAKYNFDYYRFSRELQSEYQKYENVHSRYESVWRGNDERNVESSERYIILEKKERLIESECAIHQKGLYEKDEAEYKRRWAECRKLVNALWTDWGLDHMKAENALFYSFLDQNDLTNKIKLAKIEMAKCEKNHKENKKGKYPYHFVENKEIQKLYEDFSFLLGWGVSCKKGDIMIYSTEDNSIPYEFMKVMEAHLNAERWHLG